MFYRMRDARYASALEDLRAALLSAGAQANLNRVPVLLQDQILFALAAIAQARRGDVDEEKAILRAEAALSAWQMHLGASGR